MTAPLGSLSYLEPVRRLARYVPLDYDLLEAASELSHQGQPVDAVTHVYRHLFPNLEIGDLRAEPFTFVQGSSQVTTRIDGDALVITVPLVHLTSDGIPVAALRYVLTRVSAFGQIYQPRLRGDDLYLEFRDQLSRMHPAKVLDVLRRMPDEADRVDDWLIGEFGARPLERAAIEPLSDDEAARAHAGWQTHWDEIDRLLAESQRKRSTFFLNEVTALAKFRVELVLPLCGHLGARLWESASVWNDSDNDPGKRETALARCVREMKAIGADELCASLGHASYALPPQSEGRSATISDYFGSGNYIDTIDRFRRSGKSNEAALAMYTTCTYLLARFAWPKVVADAITAALAEAGGKPWRDSATILWNHCKGLVERFCGDAEEEEEDDQEGGGEDGEDQTGPDGGGGDHDGDDDGEPQEQTS